MTRPRVLVVDDHAINLDLAAFVLGVDRFEVATAFDAESAGVQLQSFRPDLVLMDIQMPGMDGLALTRQWKADPATRHVVIIAFTAHAMKGDEARLLAAGCDGYIAKPIEVARFADQVLAMFYKAQGVTGL